MVPLRPPHRPNRSPPPLDASAPIAEGNEADASPFLAARSGSVPSNLDGMSLGDGGAAMGRSLLRACSAGGSLDEQNSLAQPITVLRVSLNGGAAGGAPAPSP